MITRDEYDNQSRLQSIVNLVVVLLHAKISKLKSGSDLRVPFDLVFLFFHNTTCLAVT